MYLAQLNIWNFRKYGTADLENEPALSVDFKNGLNLIVGENDGGKTTIIDAIKCVLGTQDYEAIRLDENDFCKYSKKKELKIECIFKDMNDEEAGKFIEWVTFDKNNNCELKVRLVAKLRDDNKIVQTISAGEDGLDTYFEARDLLRVTYLKPLRDAKNELTPGYRSRFSQILKNYPIFFKNKEQAHTLEKYLEVANEKIENYFKKEELEKDEVFKINDGEKGAKDITEFLNRTLKEFMGTDYDNNNYEAKVNISGGNLNSILSKLGLTIDENKVGLGSLNELYIAMELLLLQIKDNLKVALVEEIEAHLHPQAQLRLINYLQNSEIRCQYILTTHSITLASSVKLESLIICKNNDAFPMGQNYTNMRLNDYEFLERFLDATKANLFFAKGVILVEGDAENLLLPVLAKIVDKPLYKYGISIVNIGNTAFLRYSNIFMRKDKKKMNIPVAVVTDLDVRPEEYYEDNKEESKNIIYFADDISTLKKKWEKYNFECLKDKIFLSEDGLKDFFKCENKLASFPKGLGKELGDMIVKESDISKLKQIIKKSKEHRYSKGSIRLFTNNWTMEYDIALSKIRDRLYAAIKIAKEIKNNGECLSKLEFQDFRNVAIKEISAFEESGYSEEQIAYEIYKPLLKSQASKAVAAQHLAKNLLENKEEVKGIIENDEYLKYLINAIKYVTSNQEEGGSIE